MIHHFLPRLSHVHFPITLEVMVGLSASWQVMGLVSGLALISSDWLVEMKSTLDFFVCSLMAICTWAARPPTTNCTFSFSISSLVRWAPTAGLSRASRDREHNLQPAVAARLLDGGEGAEGPGQREGKADPDRILALGAQDSGKGESRRPSGRDGD